MPVFPSSFSHFLNFSSPLFGPIILVFGCGFSSVGWISGLSEMVLLQGAGSCPTHSTAYQPHIQLSMKEGWKDRSIIGWKERGKASEGQRMERWDDVVMEKGERGTLDGKKEQKVVWLKNGGMKQRSESARGLCGRKPGKWVSGCRGYSLLVFLFFFFFHFLALLLFPLQLPSWWTPGLLSLFSLFHLLFSSILRQLTGGPGPWWTMPSPSPTTFSLSPWSKIRQYETQANAGLFQCLWGPIAVFSHPSHDPHISCTGLVQTGADHTALLLKICTVAMPQRAGNI